MYAMIVKQICRRAFEAVNRHDADRLLGMCRPNVMHRFGGRHALGGTRHDRAGLALWLQRLRRLVPDLKLEITDIWVKGGPWKTTVIIRWTSSATPLDGGNYWNHGVHIVEMRWGKAISIDANEDSEAVADLLRRQAAFGIEEALAPPIET